MDTPDYYAAKKQISYFTDTVFISRASLVLKLFYYKTSKLILVYIFLYVLNISSDTSSVVLPHLKSRRTAVASRAQ